jgi:hypothetical protein
VSQRDHSKFLEQPANALQVSRRSQSDVIGPVCDSDEAIDSSGGFQCGVQSSESFLQHALVAIPAIDHLLQRVQARCGHGHSPFAAALYPSTSALASATGIPS